jgi:hypothetical protein
VSKGGRAPWLENFPYKDKCGQCGRATALLAALLSSALLLSSCTANVENVVDSLSKLGQEKPTADNTLTKPAPYANAIAKAIEEGKGKVTLNVVATDSELKRISENIDPFWGVPVSYLVKNEWNDVELGSTGSAISVKTVEFTLKQSVSYYAYHAYMRKHAGGASETGVSANNASGAGAGESAGASAANSGNGESAPASVPPPEMAQEVETLVDSLTGIISEVTGTKRMAKAKGGKAESYDYECALAVHDWLVRNIAYATGMDEGSQANGVTGALVGRKTMCQGYAEAFELLMRCITSADVRMVVGEGRSENSADWIDHAWNIANLGGEWYQIDATFDDPVNSSSNRVSHIYFGRSDAGLAADHRWSAEYWPTAAGGDFLYYRGEGLFADSKKEFRRIVNGKLKKGKPTELEIAVSGVKLKENDLQFIYDSYDKVDNIMYSFTAQGEVTLVSLGLEY